jgi:DNA gyrase subunit A
MRQSYLDYAMSVIVSRALPDVRDGLKPVHRRIFHAMAEGGYEWNRPYRKSARIVGDVMGKYHPHGDQPIYDAMVRMAQPFSLRLPLIDGQGNFGSLDGDPPAAMRYTEARMARVAHALLDDLDKDTVDFQDNYDSSSREPVVLPSRFPNLLANGAGGIAVGMATNIPPHNLGEVIDACCAYLDDPAIEVTALMDHVKGPDFPTGGIILGEAGVKTALMTGRGGVLMRGRVHIEEVRKDRRAIIVTEIPYQLNKSRLIEQIADVARNKRVEGITDLRDESDRDGVRVVIEVRRDVNVEVVLNQLYRYTPLQSSFGVNMLALDHGRPQLLNLRDMVAAFVDFREEVIGRRSRHELGRARDRAQILVGLAIAVANIDAVIAIIRGAPDPSAAREALIGREWPVHGVESLVRLIDEPGRAVVDGAYRLNEAQAKAILELRLARLTGLERDKIGDDLTAIAAKIGEFLDILTNRETLVALLRQELLEIKERFATPRRTCFEFDAGIQDDEDLIQREDMVVTVSHTGYIKRVPLSTYRAQRRGGRGRAGMSTREEDFVTQVFVVNTHTPVLFFSTAGKVYMLKAYRLPLGAPQARGKAMINLLPLAEGEAIATLMPMPEDEEQWDELQIMFVTSRGGVRRNRLSDFTNIMANGKIAMKLADGDQIVGVDTCTDGDDVLLAARGGKCIRFHTGEVRLFKGRNSQGVRGIRLAGGDRVISMSILSHIAAEAPEREEYLQAIQAKNRLRGGDYDARPEDRVRDAALAERLDSLKFVELADGEQLILAVTENGFGKLTSAYAYRTTRRGGQGIINIATSDRNGAVVATFPIGETDDVVLITDGGQIIRFPAADIRIAGRNTQGVTLFRTAGTERVVSVARLAEAGEDDKDDKDGEGRGDDLAAPN